jgi:uncharacterized membrane protein SpoIIM required for sporulation/ABC-type Na+ efflux pump permease subunit
MNIATVMTITRREVRDMLGDWRIMVPMFLLTFILPFMLAIGSRQFIRFVEDEGLAYRLLPFGVLLVGFIPASFSLITALETFVGERERNSLESLLAMPISDNELYIGKLISSLVPPLLSSYIAMLTYSVLIAIIDPLVILPTLSNAGVGVLLSRGGVLYLAVGLMAVAMVAGAVVISSHISSIRAANLMSSFILVPMALVIQMDAFLLVNSRWDVLWISGAALFVLAILLVRMGLMTFNREGILAREHQHIGDWSFWKRVSRLWKRSEMPHKRTITHPILTIVNREVRESLTDWRVLLPSFVLTVVIPLALVAGTGFAVDVLMEEDPTLIGRIAPFAVLLVGFIPATFSLIVALDTFVGERERNSLEALLALPISDTRLYFSKVISSIIPPLLTSISAMLIFSVALRVFHPAVYAYSMTPVRLAQLLVMISIMTVLMVAGAVIISSHTSSIRAANLLASFVLIPMAVLLQLEAFIIIVQRWEVVSFVIYILLVMAIALLRTGISAFNREEILSREHENINFKTTSLTLGTFFREYRPAGVPLREYQGLPFSPGRFYREELPALLREIRLPIGVALTAAIGGLWLGNYLAVDFRFIGFVQVALDGYIKQVGQAPPPSPLLAIAIFANNLRVSILSNVFSSFAFGIFAFLVPAVAFLQVSFIATTLYEQHGSWFSLEAGGPLPFLLGYVVPHGIIELPTFILSAALGIRIGASVLSPPPGFSVGQNLLWSLANFLKVWLLLLMPLILVGSMIEGLVSPMIIRALYP